MEAACPCQDECKDECTGEEKPVHREKRLTAGLYGIFETFVPQKRGSIVPEHGTVVVAGTGDPQFRSTALRLS
jgi:hypothetical protein